MISRMEISTTRRLAPTMVIWRFSDSVPETAASVRGRKFIKVHGRSDAHVCLSNLILKHAPHCTRLPHLEYIISPAQVYLHTRTKFHCTFIASFLISALPVPREFLNCILRTLGCNESQTL